MSQKMTYRNSDVRTSEPIAFGKLTWSGLMVAAFGWMLLLSGGSVQMLLSANAPSIGQIALCTIISGFSLAVLGALQTGFGALARFFETAMQRAMSRPEQNLPVAYEAPTPILRDISQPAPRRALAVRPAPVRTEPLVVAPPRIAPDIVAPVRTPAAAKPTQRKVRERGWWKDRAYTVFHDGSVEIETLLGLRRFSCMDDAQEFVG